MKRILYILLTLLSLLIILINFKFDKNQNVFRNHIPNQIFSQKVKDSVISISFENGIILHWNAVTHQFIKVEEYKKILNDNKKINLLIEGIKNNEDLNIDICSKKTRLKKGDIAFLFLLKNNKIEIFLCLKRQFDTIDECGIPCGLMDFLEQNRIDVSEKIHRCYKYKN
ncbi:hypothetical protein EQP59_02250 [Ornithobacterium rhinotracheale]|uniref:Uncharacterized protein n=1 Tax=Ornithobacterium rhinotracheale TaxID=28251 RepID=A0A3R5Y2J8_ORNRH|nr:hypothetical protein [Ornithobacterium rhinotracheale]QAR30262.1 hypothetical protein EQP59_02250 [Ornithobacterium rhinotracheale]